MIVSKKFSLMKQIFQCLSIMTASSTFKAKSIKVSLGKYWHSGIDHSIEVFGNPFVSEILLVVQMKRCDNLQELKLDLKTMASIFHQNGSLGKSSKTSPNQQS